MAQPKPMQCDECGAELVVLNRSAVESHGYSKPTRVDWDYRCSQSEDHPIVHWIEYP